MSSDTVKQALGPLFGRLGVDNDPALVGTLLQGIEAATVGLCLCDQDDRIRFANSAFHHAFLPNIGHEPIDFVDALAIEIGAGRGVKLLTMPLDTFIARVKARRRSATPHFQFSLDFVDGRWWLINDFKLANGWMLVIAAEISGLKREEIRLREAHAAAIAAAQTDFLTGVANRRHGFAVAELRLAEARSSRLPFCLALVDIDHFKRINDVYGHLAGDRVLVQFARALAEEFGCGQDVSRVGGEEFLVVMPGMTAAEARLRLQRFLARAAAPDPSGDTVIDYTASAGIAQAHPSEPLTDILHRADVALYEAKAKGRHRVELDSGLAGRDLDPARPGSANATGRLGAAAGR